MSELEKLAAAHRARLMRVERNRLQAFLASGGTVVREDLPAGVVAWTRMSRSGHPFSDRCVSRLAKRGAFTRRRDLYTMVRVELVQYEMVWAEKGKL